LPKIIDTDRNKKHYKVQKYQYPVKNTRIWEDMIRTSNTSLIHHFKTWRCDTTITHDTVYLSYFIIRHYLSQALHSHIFI